MPLAKSPIVVVRLLHQRRVVAARCCSPGSSVTSRRAPRRRCHRRTRRAPSVAAATVGAVSFEDCARPVLLQALGDGRGHVGEREVATAGLVLGARVAGLGHGRRVVLVVGARLGARPRTRPGTRSTRSKPLPCAPSCAAVDPRRVAQGEQPGERGVEVARREVHAGVVAVGDVLRPCTGEAVGLLLEVHRSTAGCTRPGPGSRGRARGRTRGPPRTRRSCRAAWAGAPARRRRRSRRCCSRRRCPPRPGTAPWSGHRRRSSAAGSYCRVRVDAVGRDRVVLLAVDVGHRRGPERLDVGDGRVDRGVVLRRHLAPASPAGEPGDDAEGHDRRHGEADEGLPEVSPVPVHRSLNDGCAGSSSPPLSGTAQQSLRFVTSVTHQRRNAGGPRDVSSAVTSVRVPANRDLPAGGWDSTEVFLVPGGYSSSRASSSA